MTLTELKDWLNNIPEEHLEYQVCIRDVKKEDDNKVGFRDMPLVYGSIDTQRKILAFLDVPSHNIIKELQAGAPIKGDQEKTDETV